VDQFRGIFRFTYSGDAHIVLKTKVQVFSAVTSSRFRHTDLFPHQANPLNHKQPDIHIMTGSRGMLAAKDPLVVPMLLRLSHFKLNSYVVLVVSKQKGITLVFKTDPLQNVDINSTFDSIAVIQKFIQREIEGQLRQMFREDLPGIIHRLSQQWVKAKVEAPYLDKRAPPVRRRAFDAVSAPDLSHMSPGFPGLGLHQYLLRQQSLGTLPYGRARSISGASVSSVARRSTTFRASPTPPTSTPVSDSPSSNPELENFDPTYGLRPEGLPTKSVFSSFGRLFTRNMGLGDLAEEPGEDESLEGEEEQGSFDVVDWEDAVPEYSPPPTVVEESVTEYETLPAVGGGTITRPRVYHSQSMIQPSSDISRFPDAASVRSDPQSYQLPAMGGYITPRFPSHRPQSSYNPYFPAMPSHYAEAYHRTLSEPAYDITGETFPVRPVTPDSLETQFSSSSGLVETPPSSVAPIDTPLKSSLSDRRLSVSSTNMNLHFDTWSSSSPPTHSTDPVILRPALNNTISQLSTLSHSNHTLSPYTRSLSHFTVRSVPPRTVSASQVMPERPPVKAKRKRTYRIGGSKPPELQPPVPPSPPSPSSPTPPSECEFDKSDMDQYFRSAPAPPPQSPPPDPHSAHVHDLRRRHPH
jgi:mitochondrial distribution and morphology protein 34